MRLFFFLCFFFYFILFLLVIRSVAFASPFSSRAHSLPTMNQLYFFFGCADVRLVHIVYFMNKKEEEF